MYSVPNWLLTIQFPKDCKYPGQSLPKTNLLSDLNAQQPSWNENANAVMLMRAALKVAAPRMIQIRKILHSDTHYL